MYYNLANLAPLHAAAKKSKKAAFTKILFDKEKTEATDGVILIRVTAPKQDATDAIAPSLYAADKFDKRVAPLANNTFFSLDAIANPNDKMPDASIYPNTDQIMPKEWKPDVYIDVELLERICKAAKQFHKSGQNTPHKEIGIHFAGNRSALQFSIDENKDGQTFRALIMPLAK